MSGSTRRLSRCPAAAWNGDGKADILWRNVNGSVYEWLMNGVSQNGGGSPGAATVDWQIQ